MTSEISVLYRCRPPDTKKIKDPARCRVLLLVDTFVRESCLNETSFRLGAKESSWGRARTRGTGASTETRALATRGLLKPAEDRQHEYHRRHPGEVYGQVSHLPGEHTGVCRVAGCDANVGDGETDEVSK